MRTDSFFLIRLNFVIMRESANSIKRRLKAGLILLSLFLSICASGLAQEYKVISAATRAGIGFVNVGVISKNIGTVTNESGSFSLDFGIINDDDSLRFSMIGYESRTLCVCQLYADPLKTVFLESKTYSLPELNIVYPRGREIELGYPVVTNALRSGFSDNNLGSELGIKVYVKKRLKLKDIHFNVGVCTYDSVTYRLNIYCLSDQSVWGNILTKPIYISFTKDKISEAITFDLKDYSIIIEGSTIVTLELYKDLGEGKLLFLTQFFTGTTYHRKTKEGKWIESPGQVGMYLHGQFLR
jgi:hypothetical protein